jgi:hypothetical protein
VRSRYIASFDRDMTAAIFGLLGVIVGAVINGAAAALLRLLAAMVGPVAAAAGRLRRATADPSGRPP